MSKKIAWSVCKILCSEFIIFIFISHSAVENIVLLYIHIKICANTNYLFRPSIRLYAVRTYPCVSIAPRIFVYKYIVSIIYAVSLILFQANYKLCIAMSIMTYLNEPRWQILFQKFESILLLSFIVLLTKIRGFIRWLNKEIIIGNYS